MDGNNQRPRGDSNMQSDAPHKQSSSTPLRAAVARPENQEFNVAGQDFGGLPLDKAVKDAIKSGKKAPEPINEALENLEHHVDVPLIKPTQTVFSSMGGGRNASSTEIGWGGPEGGKPKDDTPKNFVYRDEDFPPPTTASDSSPSVLSASKLKESAPSPSKSSTSDHKKLAIAELHGTKAAPYFGLDHSLFRKGSAKKDDNSSANGTPEMNLASLFPENQSSSQHKMNSSFPPKSTITRQETPEMNLNSLFLEDQSSPQHKKNMLLPLKSTLSRQDTPEMNLSILFPEVAPIFSQNAPSHEPFNAPVHLLHASGKQSAAGSGTLEMSLDKLFLEDQSSSQHKKKPSSPLKHAPIRQDTPEMNLGSLFPENQPIQPTKNASSPLKNTPIRQDTPEMNLNTLFPEDQSPSQSKKNAWSPLKSTLTSQETPEM
ncbi:hypothetical protein BGZ91_000887, partial [Linnemannia elongata]